MKKLSPAAYEKARDYMKTQARPLERAIFAHHFEGASVDAILEVTAAYQNPDGGFGKALEPDMRTPSSSALATAMALKSMEHLGTPSDHPLVTGAVEYLLATFDRHSLTWRVVPEDANDYPHAPWWHDQDGSLARTFDHYLVIPRAEIVGALLHYADLFPAEILEQALESTVVDIEKMPNFGVGGGDDISYALGMAGTKELSDDYRQRLLKRIREVVPQVVERDPAKWGQYCMQPLKIAHSPKSPIADLIWDAIQADLDYRIDHQHPEGTWEPVWTWGGAYPSAWELARQEWRGHLTLETLTILRAFGRIEEYATVEGRKG